MWAVVVLALLAVCWAQTPTPCMTPMQWEARRFRFDRKRNFTEIAKHTYDAVEQRTRSIEEVSVTGQEREFYDTLHLHKIRTEYRLNLRTKKCNVTVLDRPFFPVAIPPNAKFDFEAELGPSQIPGEHLTVEAWEGNFTDGGHYFVTVTSPSCDPVSLDFFNKDEHFAERYFDLVNGIPDPDVFIPPSECLKP